MENNFYVLLEQMNIFDAYQLILELNIGNHDFVNTRESIEDYCCEMIKRGVHVSHILAVLESESADLFEVWLGDSIGSPKPIYNVTQLLSALNISDNKF